VLIHGSKFGLWAIGAIPTIKRFARRHAVGVYFSRVLQSFTYLSDGNGTQKFTTSSQFGG